MVTCKQINEMYRSHYDDYCDLDHRLLERAMKFVGDKNCSFLKDLSVTICGVKCQVEFFAGSKTNQFVFMVLNNEIYGTQVKQGYATGVSTSCWPKDYQRNIFWPGFRVDFMNSLLDNCPYIHDYRLKSQQKCYISSPLWLFIPSCVNLWKNDLAVFVQCGICTVFSRTG